MSGDQSQITLAEPESQEHRQNAQDSQNAVAVEPGSVEQLERLSPHGDVSDEEKRQGDEGTDGKESEKHFEVGWDGEDDPLNPRSMSTGRKWLIVLIVSASSLCV